MKKCIVVSLFVLLMFSSLNAVAGECNFYVGGNVGMAMPADSDLTDTWTGGWSAGEKDKYEWSFDNGMAYSLAAGYDFGGVRVEGEIAYRGNDLDKESGDYGDDTLSGDVSSLAFMANGYYEFGCSAIRPFIMAGLGFATVSVNDYAYSDNPNRVYIDDDDTVFAYQFGAGICYDVTKKITLDASYRYFATADAEFDDTISGQADTEMGYASHNILVGLRYNF